MHAHEPFLPTAIYGGNANPPQVLAAPSRYIQGVCNRDGELLILVDLEKLLANEELQGA